MAQARLSTALVAACIALIAGARATTAASQRLLWCNRDVLQVSRTLLAEAGSSPAQAFCTAAQAEGPFRAISNTTRVVPYLQLAVDEFVTNSTAIQCPDDYVTTPLAACEQAFDIGVLYKILFAVECTSGPGSVTLEAEVFAPPQKGLFAGDSPHVAYVEQVALPSPSPSPVASPPSSPMPPPSPPADPCEGVRCSTPGLCYTGQGTCSQGTCVYAAAPAGTDCGGGYTCDGLGQCGSLADPCAGVTCETPGPCQAGPGTCSQGSCIYAAAPAGTACGSGYVCDGSGQCSGYADPCTGVTCLTPGACQTGPGTCSQGLCLYSAAPAGTSCGGTYVCDGLGQCNLPVNPTAQPPPAPVYPLNPATPGAPPAPGDYQDYQDYDYTP